MTCNERIADLVECARRQGEPDRELRAHLSVCRRCSERWEQEEQLTAQFRAIRMRAAFRSPDGFAGGMSRRESLMRDFSRIHRRPAKQSWGWTLAAAAALLLAVFIGHEAGKRPDRPVSPAVQNHVTENRDEPVVYQASADASALSSDDFIAVPYTPPLAPGEMVRVVHTNLYPEALASMGMAVNPLWAGNLAADVVEGEDGLPRAVRITDNGQF
jgi:hypothetical protein